MAIRGNLFYVKYANCLYDTAVYCLKLQVYRMQRERYVKGKHSEILSDGVLNLNVPARF